MSNQERLLELSRKVLAGDKVSDEEYKELIADLRSDRKAGAGSGKAKANPNVKLPANLDDLFA